VLASKVGLGGLGAGVAVALGVATVAWAAPEVQAFDVPAGDLASGVLQFATQAHISIGISPAAAACAAKSKRLVGRFTVEDGLRRLLEGTNCSFRRLDPQAFQIVAAPPRPARAAVAPSPSLPPERLGEVVVVATRRPTPADRLSYPVSVVDGGNLGQQAISDTAGLAFAVPSMTVTNLGAGRDKIFLRGLSDGPLTGRTQSTVGIYLDDVRLTYNAPDPDLRLVDMAQVEVLRGPQGALYGSGSLGGIVHLIPRAPDPQARSGWIAVGAGVGGAEPSNLLEGMLNVPIPGLGGAARLVGYREDDGGYIDDPVHGRSNVNRTVRSGYRLSLAQPLGADWTLTAGLVEQAITAHDTQYALAGTRYARSAAVAEPHDNDFSEAHLGVRGDLGWADLRLSAAAVRHQVTSRYDATAAPPTPAPSGPLAFNDHDAISSLVTEGSLAAKPAARWQWLAGGFLAETTQRVSLSLSPPDQARPVYFHEDRRERLTEAALFGEVTAPLGGGFAATVGGRLFTVHTQVASQLAVAAGAPAMPFSGHVDVVGFAPKLVLSYVRSPTFLVYAQAAEGYRSPGLNTTAGPGQTFSEPGGPPPERVYRKDELWSFELGTRMKVWDGRLVFRAAAFDSVWRNIQSDQLLPSGLPFTANIGDGSIQGLELEGSYRSGELTLRSSLLLNHPELDRANPAFPTRPELSLAGVPSVSGSLLAHYAVPLSSVWTMSFDGRVVYVGASHLTFDAQTSPRMSGYLTGRIAVTLQGPNWSGTLAVDNPANVYGDTFAYGNPFTVRTATPVTPLRPRTLSFRVERVF